MAVIGSGPAGFYTAYRTMTRIPQACVDMYEALPVPFGLVRFGVAPDHPEVKNCQEKFQEVAQSPRFRFVGNVAVGHPETTLDGHSGSGSVPLEVMARHYDAVVFAYGASRDRRLGVPGEDLRGVYAARDFVGWYNGLPPTAPGQIERMAADVADPRAETAVVIGQGNVALDVARMLLADADELRRTDISDAALDVLAASRVRRVHIVGRRGPMQAAFTIKEARELMTLPGVALHPVDPALLPPNPKALPRARRRLMELLAKGSTATLEGSVASWSLDFCLEPRAFTGSDSSTATRLPDPRVAVAPFTATRMADPRVAVASFTATRLADPLDANARAEPTGRQVDVPAALVFRSIGYRSEPLAGFDRLGIPFDDSRGVIRNDGAGRVLRDVRTPDGALASRPYPGLYCAGWVKRGPTGVIASTMEDAFATADAIVADWAAEAPLLGHHHPDATEATAKKHGWDGVRADVDLSHARIVSWADWQAIDRAETERGRQVGKPRSKFVTRSDMLRVLG